MHLISVIIPTFNRASVLVRALESVYSQRYSNWELIVVDDGSTDQTRELVEDWRQNRSLGKKVQILSSENRGVSSARNLGAKLAKGSWLGFLDSDDEWLPERLQSQVELLSEPSNSNLKWIHGEELWLRNDKPVRIPPKYAKSGGRIFNRCVDTCCVATSTVLIEKELFLSLGGFREDFPVCEDYDLWLKLSAQWPAGFIAKPVSKKYGGHADQLSMKYIGMDYYRCLALESILNHPYLSAAEQTHASEILLAKRQILEDGARKHSASSHLLRERI